MAFRMSSLTRARSGAWFSRKVIPTDLRDEYAALYGRRCEELFYRAADLSLSKAKVEHSDWEAEIETRFTSLRAKKRGEGHDLTQKQARALAGEWYRWFTGPHEENPGDPDYWNDLHEALWELLIHVAGDEETRTLDLEVPEVRTEVHPKLADEAKTAQFLARKGEMLTPAAMALLLNAVIYEFWEATELLQRRARGDYSSDQHLQTFPVYRPIAVN